MEERQASRQHRVILTNRGTCALNGISDILSFDVNEILLETEMGMLMIRGIDLHVNRLCRSYIRCSCLDRRCSLAAVCCWCMI